MSLSIPSLPAISAWSIPKLFSYFTEVRDELKKVTWPTKQQTINLTLLVIGASAVVALYLGLLDAGFKWLIEVIIRVR